MSKEERLEKDPTPKRVINKTDLQVGKATERGIVHRDYLAHCLRWSHVCKWLSKLKNKKKDLCVLDIGCGKENSFLKVCYTNKISPQYFLALDARNIGFEELHQEMVPNFEHEFVQCDFAQGIPSCKYDQWDLITFLEVLEHNSKEAGIKILENIKGIMGSETLTFLSTPCFNGEAAANHVYEWKYEELKTQLESMFTVEAVYGTFASQSEICKVMTECELEIFEKLRDYYDSNTLAVMFSPNHPDASRNCIWRLKLKG